MSILHFSARSFILCLVMANSKAGSDPPDNKSPDNRDSGDESEDESEVLEESPCGRWQKRREEVGL